MVLIVFAVVAVIVVLFYTCAYDDYWPDAEEQDAGGGGDTVDQPRRRPPRLEVEMAPPVRWTEPPLVCTYWKADGWREGSCGVCLADLDDGEAVRVLPACMHYFHAACVGQWLRAKATCPMCRAPTPLVVAAADAATA